MASLRSNDGALRSLNGDKGFTEQEMKEDVNTSDHYVFCYVGEAHFLDWAMRGTRHNQSTISSRSRVVPQELKEFYAHILLFSIYAGFLQLVARPTIP